MSKDSEPNNGRDHILHNFITEQTRSVFDYEKFLVKSGILINGGAAVALLAFIENLWSMKLEHDIAGSFICAFIYFVIGLLAALAVVLASYASSYFNIFLHNKAVSTGIDVGEVEFLFLRIIPLNGEKLRSLYIAVVFLFLIITFMLFILGVSQTSEALLNHFSETVTKTS